MDCSQDVASESHDQHPETVENSQSDLDMSRSMITTTSTQVSVENQDVQASQTALNLIAVAIERVRVLTDEEKYQHITTLPQTKFQKDGPIWTL